ncbi:MAG TPA: transcriptional regulator [Anaerolineae bacterium]|nr:transcriptional regulator [Anaerolineae bacterium]
MSTEHERAEADYQRARRRALFHEIRARLAGRANRLLSFEEVKQSLRLGGPVYRGARPVPVAQIVGSVDRYRDFDREFLPAQRHTAQKWKNIARAFYRDVDLPPVKLYKVGDAYFVLDGHHRVSVAREQGMAYIDAEVQEAYSRVPVTADLQAEDLKVLHEYREFLERTRLDEIRPQQKVLRLTIAGGYAQLIEHIAVHRYFMGLDLQRDVSDEEAVGHWYDTVYTPIVEAIRRHNMLASFPKRTEADLYLWIVDHLYFLRESGDGVEVDAAVEDFADQFSERRMQKLVREVQRTLEMLDQGEREAQRLESPGEDQQTEAGDDAT